VNYRWKPCVDFCGCLLTALLLVLMFDCFLFFARRLFEALARGIVDAVIVFRLHDPRLTHFHALGQSVLYPEKEGKRIRRLYAFLNFVDSFVCALFVNILMTSSRMWCSIDSGCLNLNGGIQFTGQLNG
jgi:hypothetical protein